MKISINCKSPMLSKTLGIYLQEYIVSEAECDFIISDELDSSFNKRVCLVNFSENSNVRRPFNKETLLFDVLNFADNKSPQKASGADKMPSLDKNEVLKIKNQMEALKGKSDSEIKDELENIVRDFTAKVYNLIKDKK